MPEETQEVTRERVETGAPGGDRQVVRESVSSSSSPIQEIGHRKAHYYVYYITGVIEILLVFRLVLKLLGASAQSLFVNFIYTVSGIFEYPFRGIFRSGTTQGIEVRSIFEPSTIVAMIVYGVLAWISARFIEIKAVGKTAK